MKIRIGYGFGVRTFDDDELGIGVSAVCIECRSQVEVASNEKF